MDVGHYGNVTPVVFPYIATILFRVRVMNNEQDTVFQSTEEDELETGKWYFTDSDYGAIGPYETKEECQTAIESFHQYVG